jgi:hypothetical protein
MDGVKQCEEKKVVSLFESRKKESSSSANGVTGQAADPNSLFLEAMQRNAENRERLRSERAKANKSVLRSYRIKQ